MYILYCSVCISLLLITFMYIILSGLFIDDFNYLHVHNIVQFIFGCRLPPGTHHCIVCFSRLSITIIIIILCSLFLKIINCLVHTIYNFVLQDSLLPSLSCTYSIHNFSRFSYLLACNIVVRLLSYLHIHNIILFFNVMHSRSTMPPTDVE